MIDRKVDIAVGIKSVGFTANNINSGDTVA